MMVILAHEPVEAKVYTVGFCFIMLPIFFFASGYVTKFEYPHIFDFIYKRVLKLFILYVIYGLVVPFTSISQLKNFLNDPFQILVTIKGSILLVLFGKTFWFVACLIVIMLIFAFLQILCKENLKMIMVLSTFLAIIGLAVSRTGMIYWSADTALVCQWFYMVGYMISKEEYFNREKQIKSKWLFLSVAYIAWIYFFSYIYGIENISINIAINEWKILFVTLPAIFWGNGAIIYLARMVGSLPLVNFVGRHSLVYFAFGSHGMSIAYKFFNILASFTEFPVFRNNYVVCPVICILGSVIMIIPCMIIDRYLPVLNGKFKMP